MRRPLRPNLLLVEGATDALVANHLADWYGLPDAYDYKDYVGIDALLRALPERLKESERKRVAVVVDADTDLAARWQSVQKKLQREDLKYVLPGEPAADGTIIEPPHSGLPRVGVWIMPDNTSTGILENFLQSLIPQAQGDNLLELAKRCVGEIPNQLFPPSHIPKAEIYTWLAWQKRPGCSFGPAIKDGLLDGSHPLARRFVEWVSRLFELPASSTREAPS